MCPRQRSFWQLSCTLNQGFCEPAERLPGGTKEHGTQAESLERQGELAASTALVMCAVGLAVGFLLIAIPSQRSIGGFDPAHDHSGETE